MRHGRRRRVYAAKSNTARHFYNEKSDSQVFMSSGLRLVALRAAEASLLHHCLLRLKGLGMQKQYSKYNTRVRDGINDCRTEPPLKVCFQVYVLTINHMIIWYNLE